MANKNFRVRNGLDIGDGLSISDAATFTTASNGNITLDPDGSGDVILTFANGGNLSNSRNYVYGAIRNSTTENNGDHWNTVAGTGYRGVTLDNSIDTTKRTGMTIRSYGISGGAPRTGIIFEGARGTAASPTNLNNGDVIADIFANGYTSTGWASDQVAIVPGIARFVTTEAWNDGLNKVGTGFRILLQPNSTALTTSSVVTALDVTATQATVQKLFTVSNNRSTGSSDFATINFSTQKFTSPNFIPTSLGDTLGQFKFNGNTSSGSSSTPGAPAALVGAQATENWTPTANGTEFYFTATKTGTTTQVDVIKGSSDSTTFKSDAYNFQNSSGTNYMVVNNSKILNNRPHRNVITTATTTEGSTYSPAATDNNSISLTINTGSGTTVIDLANLTGQGDGGMYTIMVFNNAASGTPIQVKNTRINTNNLTTHTIPTGDRIMITAYIVGDYATAEHLVVA